MNDGPHYRMCAALVFVDFGGGLGTLGSIPRQRSESAWGGARPTICALDSPGPELGLGRGLSLRGLDAIDKPAEIGDGLALFGLVQLILMLMAVDPVVVDAQGALAVRKSALSAFLRGFHWLLHRTPIAETPNNTAAKASFTPLRSEDLRLPLCVIIPHLHLQVKTILVPEERVLRYFGG
jgi:hypothetical protein